MKKINILGTEYILEYRSFKKDKKLENKELDEELFELYQVCLNLYHKYGIVEE